MGNVRNTIKNNLKYLIEKSEFSKKQIATKLNTSPASITNWINGSNSPDIETIALICKLFNISVVDLFEYDLRNDTKITPPDEESEERDTSEKELMSWIETLDTVKIKRLLDILYLIELPDSDYEKISELIRLFLGKDK